MRIFFELFLLLTYKLVFKFKKKHLIKIDTLTYTRTLRTIFFYRQQLS